MKKEGYKIRRLCAEDIFSICDIIGKCGVSEFKNCFSVIAAEDNPRSTGIAVTFEIAGVICRNILSCKKEICSFMADLTGVSEDEISSLELMDFAELIKEILQKKELKDFFSVVSGFFLSAL